MLRIFRHKIIIRTFTCSCSLDFCLASLFFLFFCADFDGGSLSVLSPGLVLCGGSSSCYRGQINQHQRNISSTDKLPVYKCMPFLWGPGVDKQLFSLQVVSVCVCVIEEVTSESEWRHPLALTLLHWLLYSGGWCCWASGRRGESTGWEWSPLHLIKKGAVNSRVIIILMHKHTSNSSCLAGVSIRSISVPQKCQILYLKQGASVIVQTQRHRNKKGRNKVKCYRLHARFIAAVCTNKQQRTHPFPTLRRGAVVAVTKCTPSGHHSNWVESLAFRRECGWHEIVCMCAHTQ